MTPRRRGRPLKRREFAPEDYLFEDLLDRIRELNLTQIDVARKAKMHHANFSHFLDAREGTDLRTFQRVVKAVGLKLVLVEENTH